MTQEASDKALTVKDIDPEELDKLNALPVIPFKIKLTIPVVGMMLEQGFSQAAIGRRFSVTRSAVSQFISKHRDELSVFLDYDKIVAAKLKHKANELIESLTEARIKKIPPQSISLNICQLVDKFRLLEDKSTANLSFSGLVRSSVTVKSVNTDE